MTKQPPRSGEQVGQLERLRQQDLPGSKGQQVVEHIGPARRVDDREVRVPRPHQAGDPDAVQAPRHVDVRHQQGEGSRVLRDQDGGLVAVLGFAHGKAAVHQFLGDHGADQPLVLDEQDAHGSGGPDKHTAHFADVERETPHVIKSDAVQCQVAQPAMRCRVGQMRLASQKREIGLYMQQPNDIIGEWEANSSVLAT